MFCDVASALTVSSTWRTRPASSMAAPVCHLNAATGSAVCNRCAAASTSSTNGFGLSALASGATALIVNANIAAHAAAAQRHLLPLIICDLVVAVLHFGHREHVEPAVQFLQRQLVA